MSDSIKKIIKSKIAIIFIVIVIFLIGFSMFNRNSAPEKTNTSENLQKHEEHTIWTCSMHPQIRLPKPGKCPICGMTLIPVQNEHENEGSSKPILNLSDAAKKLAEIEVEPVERKYVASEIRMTGKIDYDETRVKYITVRFGGRLERLYVDYTGVPVSKSEHLVDIYSPDLITAQEELLQSLKLANGTSGTFKKIAEKTVQSAREKLLLWGLTETQIESIEKAGKTEDILTIYSPISGIVTEKNAVEGMYVSTGEKIYTIADLSHLWLKLDAFESDISYLNYGQKVEFNVEAYPGETFEGRIAFINPVLDEITRTIKIRVNVDNTGGKLKPGMFARSIVKAKLGSNEKLINTDLSGKWICPMHPEIIKDHSGSCDICGMALVPAEKMGFDNSTMNMKPPLMIKASAPLITGKRAIVYIQDPDKEKPTYSGREIILGPRVGDYYIVRSGLSEGELVVVNGNFKIDSALQINAKPSMMNPEGDSKQVESMKNMNM
jgi:membrane fusion protein, copper/silver efflux system